MAQDVISFIGAGNMARSLIGGLVSDGYDSGKIWVACPTQEALDPLHTRFGVHTSTDNVTVAQHADVIVFAVKPQIIPEVVQELKSIIQTQHPLLISIAAGIPIKKIQSWLASDHPVVRCMPNTPALLRTSATALYASESVSTEQKDISESIMRAVGLAVWVDDEQHIDIVTALSGSGPAYFFMVIEAMQKAAEALGLPSDKAKLLTLQTALGAARMALESEQEAGLLRQQVTSKGGTTEAAMKVFEQANVSDIFAKAMGAARARAVELSEQ